MGQVNPSKDGNFPVFNFLLDKGRTMKDMTAVSLANILSNSLLRVFSQFWQLSFSPFFRYFLPLAASMILKNCFYYLEFPSSSLCLRPSLRAWVIFFMTQKRPFLQEVFQIFQTRNSFFPFCTSIPHWFWHHYDVYDKLFYNEFFILMLFCSLAWYYGKAHMLWFQKGLMP